MHQQAVPNISPAPPIFPAPPTGHKAQNMPADSSSIHDRNRARVGEGPTGCKYFKEIILSEKSVLPIFCHQNTSTFCSIPAVERGPPPAWEVQLVVQSRHSTLWYLVKAIRDFPVRRFSARCDESWTSQSLKCGCMNGVKAPEVVHRFCSVKDMHSSCVVCVINLLVITSNPFPVSKLESKVRTALIRKANWVHVLWNFQTFWVKFPLAESLKVLKQK